MAADRGISTVEKLNETIGSAIIKDVCHIWGYKSHLEDLVETVSNVRNVLLHAEAKQELSCEDQGCIEELKDAVYDADKLFDEVITVVEHKQLRQHTKRSKLLDKVRRFFSSQNQLGQTYRMSRSVKEIMKRLDGIPNRRHNKSEFNVDYKPLSSREETFVDGKEIIGGDKDKETIVDSLQDRQDHNVVEDFCCETTVGGVSLGDGALSQIGHTDCDDNSSQDGSIISGDKADKETIVDSLQDHNVDEEFCSETIVGGAGLGDSALVQLAHADSDYNSTQNGSEECAISIKPEQRPNQEPYPIPTPESRIQSQHNYDNERLIDSVPRIIMRIICCVIFNKWLYRVLNVILEISQVTFAEVNDKQMISDYLCYKLIFIISSICLLISLGEYIIKVKQSKVVFERRSMCCWFYYPGINRRLFGSLPLNFSVISSATQFCVNLAILLLKKRFFKADYIALLFAIVALISPMNHHQEETEESDHEV